MEIKAILQKPYTQEARINFIVEYNHNQGLTIEETETEIQALGYTEEELQQQEYERIQELSMTRSDFFDGTIKAFGADSEDLLVAIQSVLAQSDMTDIEKKVAINNYKNALNFYRKHPLFTVLSGVPIPIGLDEEGLPITITITDIQWDKFFDETNKKNPDAWKELFAITVEYETADDETPSENEAGGEVITEEEVVDEPTD